MPGITLFKNKGKRGQSVDFGLGRLASALQSEIVNRGSELAGSAALTRAAISMESIDKSLEHELDSALDNLNHALEGIITDLESTNVISGISQTQKTAALAAGVLAGDARAVWDHSFAFEARTESLHDGRVVNEYVGAAGISDMVDKRIGMEAYDERENRNAQSYTIAYNMAAAKQDEFAETFFPTVVVTPDQLGYAVSIRLINVLNDIRRSTSGAVSRNFEKRNIIQAVIDPTILRNDQTRIIPVYRDEAKQNFVDAALVPPKDIIFEGESIQTAPLAVNKKFQLLGLSQTDALLQTGILDVTDAIDPAIQLESLYIQIGTEVFRVSTLNLPLATFAPAVQGNYRLMQLNFSTQSVLFNGSQTKVDGSASTALKTLSDNKVDVRLGFDVSGSVNLELSDTSVFASDVAVYSVRDEAGNLLDVTTGDGKTYADLFAGAKVIGYTLEARRTNSNRRERGQLLDTTFYTQIYAVPLRSPITALRPLGSGDSNDASDLASLITATHIRTTNAAIDTLLETADTLSQYANNRDQLGTTPDIMGVSRFLVTPYFKHETLDVAAVIDSLKSHERAEDLQAAIVNVLRDMAYRMYRDSGYKAAADALSGGVAPVPTVIIGTDPVIARYLTVTGDLRTLAGGFKVRVVSTLNERMANKIVMTFGEFENGKDGVPNPLHFGNMAWKPELVLVLPLHRNGANSKELTVQPQFRHIVNLPIMAVLDVVNIEAAVDAKVPVNTVDVTPAADGGTTGGTTAP
jgi:hypothetical protein